MELKHYFYYYMTKRVGGTYRREEIGVEIDEPIGFDNFSMTMKRHEYHGMGAEVSLDNLEFYGRAFVIIESCYDANIDTALRYVVYDDDEPIYSGQVDLSTCSFKEGDYQSVSVKVGEIGAKTTFNNRLESEIDLNIPKTIDGADVEAPEWQTLRIPMKHLLYTNYSEQKIDAEPNSFGTSSLNKMFEFNTHIGDAGINEFGHWEAAPDKGAVEDTEPQYYANEDHAKEYGSETKAQLDIHFVAEFNVLNRDESVNIKVTPSFVAQSGDQRYYALSEAFILQRYVSDGTHHIVMDVHANVDAEQPLKYWGRLHFENNTHYDPEDIRDSIVSFSITIKEGSYVKMTMYDNLEEEPADVDMIIVNDALDVVTHAISENELSIKSDWYSGKGALKALTNGYKIRGLFTKGSQERNMPLSFKNLIKNMQAQDCIGWGFSTEDDETYVRVERWDWFYQENVLLRCEDANDLTIEVATDYINTEFKIGYKKYATSDQYNSIESPHGVRIFANGIKAVSKSLAVESEFIADNYAIEETRRARSKSETEESTYDENIFIFELVHVRENMPSNLQGSTYREYYVIGHTAKDAKNVGRVEEFINAQLTPRHMAARWRDYLFAANNTTPFRFTSGEINYKSSFSVRTGDDYPLMTQTTMMPSFATTEPQSEDDDIVYTPAIFKAEKLKFTYPITIEQYGVVKNNPYGLVYVNGRYGWILEFKYSFTDGLAEFTLLAKR